MPAAPYVSVIIPTYNRARMLQVTLDSFLAQDYPQDRYEIIVANNNSTDDTQRFLEDYSSKHPRVGSLPNPSGRALRAEQRRKDRAGRYSLLH